MNPSVLHVRSRSRGATRRYAALGAAVATAVLLSLTPAAATEPTDPTAPPPDPTVMPEPAPMRIASFNAAAFLRTGKTMSDLAAIVANNPDIVALQEMSSPEKRAQVRERFSDCETCAFDFYEPPGGALPAGTPILYRSDRFRLLSSGSVQVTQPTYVGPRGAGPSTIRAKFVNWVRLKDSLTQRQVCVLNNHAVPTVQASSGGPNGNTARMRIYRKHMNGLTALVTQLRQTTGCVLFVTGDFNVNYRSDRIVAAKNFPYRRLGAVSVHASYELLGEPEIGTHLLPSGFDKRLIDYVSMMSHKGAVALGQTILTGLYSDHRPIVLEAALRYKRKFYPPAG